MDCNFSRKVGNELINVYQIDQMVFDFFKRFSERFYLNKISRLRIS